jgi:hypothetical protein
MPRMLAKTYWAFLLFLNQATISLKRLMDYDK